MTRRPWLALMPLVAGTFLGTVSSGIPAVPLRAIATDLGAQLPASALVLVSFLLTFAVTMPFAGWLGDRMGSRRVYCAALAGLALGSLGAAVAPSLPVLVAWRVIQGAATGAVLPTVMSMITDLFGPGKRGRALGVWAAMNGLGQAAAPVTGGVIAQAASWRWIFVPLVPLALFVLVVTVLLVPADRGVALPLHWGGAATLMGGTGSIIAAAAVAAQPGAVGRFAGVPAAVGVALLVLFVVLVGRADQPFVSPALLREPSYVRSSVAVFAQMFCLGATLLGVPMFLTGTAAMSTAVAGVVVLALPVAMTVLAPMSGLLTDRLGPRRVIRAGLGLLVVAQLSLAVALSVAVNPLVAIVVALAGTGVGVAMVQTPSALGATRSEVGRVGSSLGLFNLIRFTGSAIGTAWVAIAVGSAGAFGLMFGVCAVVAALGLAGTFADPFARPHAGAASTTP